MLLGTMGDRKAVSLSDELYHLIRTIDAVRQLSERLGEASFEEGALLLSIASTLLVVKERMKLLDRAVRGSVDPFILWCAENDGTEPLEGDKDEGGGDVLLWSWSDGATVRRLRKQLKSAKRRLQKSRTT
ncbi:MAG: hypothetical protein KF850_20070 [Labilithrix sp.]|nr:hypothetical protein [Labilithrix sp.]